MRVLRTEAAGAVYMKELESLESSNKWLLGPVYKIWNVGHASLPDPWTSSGIPGAQRCHCRGEPGLAGWALFISISTSQWPET